MTDLHALASPDEWGSDTFARFKYQAHATFPYVLGLATGETVTEVFTEHFEDIAVRESATWRFLQVKSRNAERGPWSFPKVIGSGAIGSLWRAYQAASTVDATYEICVEGALGKDDLLHSLTDGTGDDDEALTRVAQACGVEVEEVRPFAERLRVRNLPPLEAIAAQNIRLLIQQAPAAAAGDVEKTYHAAVAAIEAAMTAQRLEGDWPAALFLSRDERLQARVERKRITRERAQELLAPILGAARSAAVVGPSRAPRVILPAVNLQAFTGRTVELQQLEALLLRAAGEKITSIAGVSGTGGIGKSALACRFADLHQHEFPDGVIGLRVDGREPASIAREFAARAGVEIEPDDERDASTIMQEVFRHRRALLIFDNADDVTVRALLPGGTRCAVIITTRDRGLPAALGVPADAQLDLMPLPPDEALALLERIAGARIAAEATAAQRVCELVGHLPLALQIAGATLRMRPTRSVEDYAAALAEERNRLSLLTFARDAALDVRASFSLSLRLLEEPEIDFFASLSVCAADGFSLMAAAAANGCEEAGAEEHIDRLFALSLVNVSLAELRYVLHPLIRLFAREQAEERGALEGAEERHRAFYVDLVKTKTRETSDPRAATMLGREIDDIVAAAESMCRSGTLDYDFVIRLEPFFQRHGYWEKAAVIFAAFLEAAEKANDWNAVVQLRLQKAKFLMLRGKLAEAERALDTLDRVIERIEPEALRQRATAMWLDAHGGVLQRLGRFDDAVAAFERSVTIELALGNPRGHAKVLNSLGSALQRKGAFDKAADMFRRSAEIDAQLGNQRGEAMTLNSLGGVLQRQGDFDNAIQAFYRSNELLTALSDLRGQAMVLNSLGGVLQRKGDFDGAVEVLQQATVIERRLRNGRGEAMVLNSLGGVLQRQGKFDEAVVAFRRSYDVEVALGDARGQAMVLNSLGGVLQRQGKFDEAADAFRRSYAISEELGDQRSLAMVLNSLGGVLQRLGKLDEAADAFRRSYETEVELRNSRGQAMVLNSLGGVLQRQGKFDEAVRAFRRSVAIGEELGDTRHVAMVLNSLGGVLQRQRKLDEAVDAFRRSYAISDRLRDQHMVAMVLNSLGGVLQRQRKLDEAVDAFRRSYGLLQELGDRRGQAMVLNSLGGALQRRGKREEAFDAFRASIAIGEELGDRRHLAMVHTAFGRALLRTDRDAAVRELREGFELDAALKNRKGVEIVAPILIETLLNLDRVEEAAEICKRALVIAPRDPRLLGLQADIERRSRER